MDLDAVKVLLESQDRAFRTALDVVVDQLKSRIQVLEGTTTDLIKSLEYSQAEVRDLQSDLRVLRKSDSEKSVMIDDLKLRLGELAKRLNYQEDYSRRNNLRITGITEQPGGETWEQTAESVTKLLEDKLQLPAVNLERAHRVGQSVASRPRTVVARFEKFGDREAVIRNARKLKGTGIYINEDLCPASQEIKNNQLPLLKQARQEGKIAYFKHTRLIIKHRTEQPTTSSPPAMSVSDTDGAGGRVPAADGVPAGRTGAGDGPTAAAAEGTAAAMGVAGGALGSTSTAMSGDGAGSGGSGMPSKPARPLPADGAAGGSPSGVVEDAVSKQTRSNKPRKNK